MITALYRIIPEIGARGSQSTGMISIFSASGVTALQETLATVAIISSSIRARTALAVAVGAARHAYTSMYGGGALPLHHDQAEAVGLAMATIRAAANKSHHELAVPSAQDIEIFRLCAVEALESCVWESRTATFYNSLPAAPPQGSQKGSEEEESAPAAVVPAKKKRTKTQNSTKGPPAAKRARASESDAVAGRGQAGKT